MRKQYEMSADERAEIRAEVATSWKDQGLDDAFLAQLQTQAVNRAEVDLIRLTHDEQKIAQWRAIGVDILRDWNTRFGAQVERDRIRTEAALRAAVIEEIHDPEMAESYDDDDLDEVTAWLGLSPFRIWRFHNKVEMDALFQVQDRMAAMVANGEDFDVAEFVRVRWEKLVREWSRVRDSPAAE